MTTDFHTPIATNAPANASTFNTPMGQLDSAVGGVFSGTNPFNRISFNAATTLTIASGSVTPTLGLHLIAAQTGTSDNLDTITAVNNSFLFIKADAGDTITLTSAGNLNADNIVMSGNTILLLFCQNGQWSIVNTSTVDKFSNRLFVSGLEITAHAPTNTVVIEAGSCSADDNEFIINTNSGLTVSMSGSGALGLDTGSVANNTWYYIWLVAGSSGVSAVASTSVTSPTLPSGYTTHKRRIGAVRTNGSANVYAQTTARGQYNSRRVYYLNNTNASPFQILNEANIGQTGSRTAINVSAVVPQTSQTVIALIEINTPSGAANVFWSAGAAADQYIMNLAGTGMISSTVYDLPVIWNAGTADIYSSAAVDEDLSLYVLGYIDDGLAYLGYTP